MDYPVTIDFGENGGKRRFEDEASILKFISDEMSAWNFVQPLRPQDPSGAVNQAFNNSIVKINNFRTQVYNSNSETKVDQLVSQIRNIVPSSDFPISFSQRGKFVLEIKAERGNDVAIGCLAGILRVRFDGGNPGQFEGMLIANNLASVSARRTGIALKRSVGDLVNRMEEQRAELETALDKIKADSADAETARHQEFESEIEDAKSKIDSTIKDARSDVDGAIAKINATNSTYSEFMSLKGPVDYWSAKARTHRKSSAVARNIGLAFAAVITVYIFFDGAQRAISLVEEAIRRTGQWQVAYVVLAVILIMLTIVFWIGRLISRLYVSEQHLATDAEERATMVMTYLALADENKVSEAERAIVLASLFRPSADGLVRDDGSPDLSLASLVSRLAVSEPTK